MNIDDCWQLTERSLPWDDPNARQVANPERFPNGMKALADYIHGKGLKFGVHYIWDIWRCDFILFWERGGGNNKLEWPLHIQTFIFMLTCAFFSTTPNTLKVYTARCKYTCQLFAASFGHEVADAKQWVRKGPVHIYI